MTKSAAPSVKISNWRTYQNKTLRGFFTATLPSGMIIDGCMLHEKNNDRWIGLPSREYKQKNGERRFSPIISFVDEDAEDRFRDQVLAALDRDEPWKGGAANGQRQA